MPHVFISYSAKDSAMAQKLWSDLKSVGTEPFLAELDLKPGAKWKDDILKRLKESQWVFFLATPNSCESQAVAHEIGASLVLEKRFIPIMWKVSPAQLPPWVDDRQAVDLQEPHRIRELVMGVGEKVKSEKFLAGAIFAILLLFAAWCLSKKK